MEIVIVGQECPLQKKLMQNVLDALHELELECSLNVVHEMKEILEMETQQLLLTPALIVDKHILCEGHIWEKEHIKHFLAHVCGKNGA